MVRTLAQNLALAGVKELVRHPSEVEMTDLDQSDLVLIDFELDYWQSRDSSDLELSLRPPDGVALKSTLRRHAANSDGDSPCAFAILTGKMLSLCHPLPAENREHILSSIYGLEWVFSKTEQNLANRIKELARTIRSLPTSWSGNGIEELNSLLGISRSRDSWKNQMTEDALRCLPPVHELTEWSHGLAFVRWMLQRILPYPTFLLEPIHLAARLGVDPDQLIEHLSDPKSSLRTAFKSCEYKGVLQSFSGPRWWRVTVEALLWEKTKGQSFDRHAVRQFLSEASKSEIGQSDPAVDPIVCYDRNFRPIRELSTIGDAVRLRPDDWPVFADDAWAKIDHAREDETLRAVVIQDDTHKLAAS